MLVVVGNVQPGVGAGRLGADALADVSLVTADTLEDLVVVVDLPLVHVGVHLWWWWWRRRWFDQNGH